MKFSHIHFAINLAIVALLLIGAIAGVASMYDPQPAAAQQMQSSADDTGMVTLSPGITGPIVSTGQ